jgi:hypothetical protein
MKLYEINAEYRAALDAAMGEIDDSGEIPEDWAAWIDSLEMDRNAKALDTAVAAREMAVEFAAIKDEIKRLQRRAAVAGRAEESLKSYLASNLHVGEKLKDARVSIGWRKSTATVIDDESLLPESCFKIVREVSKTEVKNQIEAGVVLEGAHIETRHNLQVR